MVESEGLRPTVSTTPQKIYLIGICGTAMGALAGMLQEQGHQVIGSDTAVYPPISTFLADKGIEILEGFKAEHIGETRPDLVVVGNVVRRENPEAVRVMETELPYLSMPEAIKRYFLQGRESVVAAGTHGKTTITSLLAWLLEASGQDPSLLVGGVTGNFNSNYKLGKGPHFVIEGDEYDTAFFDKVPKFVHYQPKWAVLSGVEFDHADIYPDFEAVQAAFDRFVKLIPPQGRLLVYVENEVAMELAAKAACPVIPYGFGPKAKVRAADLQLGPGQVSFELVRDNERLGRFVSSLPGRYNVANTLACLGLLLEMGLSPKSLEAGLRGFRGIKRRQEIVGQVADILIMDDFAHHPTAVRETLAGLRQFYDQRRLVAVFEPRTNTSRRNIFQNAYPASFTDADVVLVREAPGLESIPQDERFSSAQLVADLKARGQKAHYFQETEAILEFLTAQGRPRDLIAVLSNGGFDGLHTRLIESLTKKYGHNPINT